MKLNVELASGQKSNIASFILDASGSMSYPGKDANGNDLSESRIEGLRRGYAEGLRVLKTLPVFKNSLRVNYVTMKDPPFAVDFVSIQNAEIPQFSVEGGTPLGAALNLTLDRIEALLFEINDQGGLANVPYIILVSDGEPNMEPKAYLDEALNRARSLEAARKLFVFPMAVTPEDISKLDALGFSMPAVDVAKMEWAEAFRFVSMSMGCIATGQVPMPVANP